MLRAKKVETVDGLRGIFGAANAVIVTHYQGLTVAEITDLRRQMRAAGAGFRVTKNRLAKIALEDTDYRGLVDLFVGPTAIAFSDDPIAAPKAATAFAKRNDKLTIVGGGLSGHMMSAAEVRALADLPSLDELRAKLIGLITTPATRIASVLQAPAGQMARVLAAHAEQG